MAMRVPTAIAKRKRFMYWKRCSVKGSFMRTHPWFITIQQLFVKSLTSLEIRDQKIGDTFKRIEAESLADWGAKIRVRVDVVEDVTAISGFQVFDSGDVQAAFGDDSFSDLDSSLGNFLVWVEFHGFCRRLFR